MLEFRALPHADRFCQMHWLLPLTIVLLASILLAVVHFLFTRWLARQSEPVRTDSPGGADDIAG